MTHQKVSSEKGETLANKIANWLNKSDKIADFSRFELNVTRGVWFIAGAFAAIIGLTPHK